MTGATATLPLRKRVVYSLLIGGIVFLLLEIGMIIAGPLLFRGFFEYDPDLGFRVRPYVEDSNRFGFNAPDFTLEKPDGIYRILILGDSFNWAGGRDGNYTAYIQKRFDQRMGAGRIQVINAGYPMTHTAEQLGVLKKYGLQYSPDFVLLGFFMGNDFIDADPNRKRIVVNDSYVDIDRRYEMTIFGHPLIPYSRLLMFIWQKIRILKEFGIQTANAMLREETFMEVRAAQLEFFDEKQHARGVYAENIRYILTAISEMQRLLKERNIRFAVSVFPDQLQVDPALLDQIARTHGADAKAFDLTLPNRILAAHLEKNQIEFVDLLATFKQAREQQSLYLERDTHWNEAGNRLAANAIYEFLIQRIPAMQGFQTIPGLSPRLAEARQ